MRDLRYQKLAEILIGHSTRVQPGEKVLIEVSEIPVDMATTLIEAVAAKGALPFVEIRDQRIQRTVYMNCTDEQMILQAEFEMLRMKAMDVYIGIRGLQNSTETADVSQEKMKIYMDRVAHPVHFEERVNNTKWCVLRWPTSSMAQAAGMSTEAFEDFFFDVSTMDYERMKRAQEPLQQRLEQADAVRLVGPYDTDLRFSIAEIPVISCTGEHNIPDGETFTAPVRDSVNGIVHFNTPTLYQGQPHDNIRLEFQDGKVIRATGSDTERLNEILDTDLGARYVGEFSVAYNPYILKPMRDILFDEKIAGSIHFTPGQAYNIANNGNVSSIHWDLVLIQRPEYGGGEIYLDNELVRKDGLFVTEDLKALNPEELLS